MDIIGNPRTAILILALLVALLLAGCGGGAPGATAPTSAPAAGVGAFDAPAAAPTAAPAAAEPPAAPAAGTAAGGGGQQAATPAPGSLTANDPTRKIIKDAQLTLEVPSVELALSRISGSVAQVGGYILETRTDYTQ